MRSLAHFVLIASWRIIKSLNNAGERWATSHEEQSGEVIEVDGLHLQSVLDRLRSVGIEVTGMTAIGVARWRLELFPAKSNHLDTAKAVLN